MTQEKRCSTCVYNDESGHCTNSAAEIIRTGKKWNCACYKRRPHLLNKMRKVLNKEL